jgi:hypothetical protein
MWWHVSLDTQIYMRYVRMPWKKKSEQQKNAFLYATVALTLEYKRWQVLRENSIGSLLYI